MIDVHRAVKVTLAACALVLAALGGWIFLMSNTGCAIVTAETMEAYEALQPATMPSGPFPPLNETEVEAEQPALARLLDKALAEGRASERDERTARAMDAFLQTKAPSRLFSWRGEEMHYSLAVC